MSSTLIRKSGGHRHRAARRRGGYLPVALVLLGVFIMLYPVVSTAYHNYTTAQAAKAYAKLDQNTPPAVRNQQWEDAVRYNRERAQGPILDPWLNEFPVDSPQYQDYLGQLASGAAMARLIVPSINVDLPIYHGTEEQTLQRGIGHLFGSDLPVGGVGTHAVLTGHTGLPDATLFDNLADLREGEAFYIQVSGHKLKYVVDHIMVVLPDDTDALHEISGEDYITLVTCTPYGINSHRLLVRGRAAPLAEKEAQIFDFNHGSGWQWWMFVLSAVALLVLLALLWWLSRPKKRHHQEEHNES